MIILIAVKFINCKWKKFSYFSFIFLSEILGYSDRVRQRGGGGGGGGGG